MRLANQPTIKSVAVYHKKFGDPWSKYNNGQNGENDPDFSICLSASLSTEIFCHCFVHTGEFRCLSLDTSLLNLYSGFLSR